MQLYRNVLVRFESSLSFEIVGWSPIAQGLCKVGGTVPNRRQRMLTGGEHPCKVLGVRRKVLSGETIWL
jgi:hypothetical protein